MAKWQKVVLHQKTYEATAARQNTITVDLPEKDYLSQILVKIYKTNSAWSSDDQILPVFYFVKKLEVIDGSYMLVAQAIRSFELWTGIKIDFDAVYSQVF